MKETLIRLLLLLICWIGMSFYACGAQREAEAREVNNALLEACAAGHAVQVSKLLDAGANVRFNIRAHPAAEFDSPLLRAIFSDRSNIIDLLLQRGAVDPDKNVEIRELGVAAFSGKLHSVQQILEYLKRKKAFKTNFRNCIASMLRGNKDADAAKLVIWFDKEVDSNLRKEIIRSFEGHPEVQKRARKLLLKN